MEDKKVRIVDIANELGLSTATVSNVIRGKNNKVSKETARRVQQKIEEMNYIPNMAGILLAQNNSRIIGVIINDHPKYEGHVLEDGYISSSLNELSKVLNQNGSFMMVKTTDDPQEIPRVASMWNMDGMVLIGFGEACYRKLRRSMHIPFVIFDGYIAQNDSVEDKAQAERAEKFVNIMVDNYDGGVQAGRYLREKGHERAICIADNSQFLDKERLDGFRDGFGRERVTILEVPMEKSLRIRFYAYHMDKIRENTAAFAVSDFYAIDFIDYIRKQGINVPGQMSVIGFDDHYFCQICYPMLTTIRQSAEIRAKAAIQALESLKNGQEVEKKIILPVHLIERESVCTYTGKNE